MNRRRSLILIYSILLMSCSWKKHLSKKDYEWIPYKGNEILIYNSNLGNRDTIFLLKKDTIWNYPDAQSLFGSDYEMVSIFCKHSDSVIQDKSVQYLENDFCSIQKTKNGHTILTVNLLTKDAVFYRLSLINLDSLDRVDPIILKTKQKQYDDVFIIKGEDYSGSFHKRYNFVTKIYWSKTKGLVRYDKGNNNYWELAE